MVGPLTDLGHVGWTEKCCYSRHDVIPGGLTQWQCRQPSLLDNMCESFEGNNDEHNHMFIQSHLEPFCAFAVPIANETCRADDDNASCQRPTSQQLMSIVKQCPEKRDTLQGLTKTHVIGEDAPW